MGKSVDAIIVPVGGGGLIAGISVVMKRLSSNTEVIVRVLILAAKLCRKWLLNDLGVYTHVTADMYG